MAIVRKQGDKYGCSDQDPPEIYSEYVMSRVLDALDCAPDHQTRAAYWVTLCRKLRMEFHFRRWQYHAPDPQHPDHMKSRKFVDTPTLCVYSIIPPTPYREPAPDPYEYA